MIKRLVSNSFSNVSVLILKMIITFIMSPVIVSSLGNYDYGIWEIVFCVVGYMGLLDIGLPTAIVRYVAKYNAEEDNENLDKLYSSSLMLMGSIGFLIFLVFIVWIIVAPDSFLKEGETTRKYIWFLLIIGTELLITFPGYVFQSVHQGYQRYSLLNLVTVINSVVGAALIYTLLRKGGGIIALALVNGIGMSSKLIIYWILLRFKKYGRFRFKFKNISGKSIKELYSFGFKSLIIGVSIQISMSTGPFVIGAFLGPEIVTFYVIPIGLVKNAVNLIASLTLAFLPAFSDLKAKNEYDKIAGLYLNASRFVVGLVVPIIIGILFMGDLFIARWMGPEYAEKGKYVIYIITIALTLAYLNPFSNRFLTGIGKQEILARLRFVSALINLVLSLLLVKTFGKEGVAFAVLIPALILEPFILYSVCRQLRISVFKYIYSVFVPILLPAAAIGLFLFNAVIKYECKTYLEIFSISGCAMIVYLIVFALVSLKKGETRIFKDKFRNLFDRI